MGEDQLQDVRDRNENWIMSQPGVTGTGIGLNRGQVVLKIFSHGAPAETRQAVAKRLVGVPIAWEDGDVIAY
jgi:hypothetical protein